MRHRRPRWDPRRRGRSDHAHGRGRRPSLRARERERRRGLGRPAALVPGGRPSAAGNGGAGRSDAVRRAPGRRVGRRGRARRRPHGGDAGGQPANRRGPDARAHRARADRDDEGLRPRRRDRPGPARADRGRGRDRRRRARSARGSRRGDRARTPAMRSTGPGISLVEAALGAVELGAKALHDPTEGGLSAASSRWLRPLRSAFGSMRMRCCGSSPACVSAARSGCDPWSTLASGTLLAAFPHGARRHCRGDASRARPRGRRHRRGRGRSGGRRRERRRVRMARA